MQLYSQRYNVPVGSLWHSQNRTHNHYDIVLSYDQEKEAAICLNVKIDNDTGALSTLILRRYITYFISQFINSKLISDDHSE